MIILDHTAGGSVSLLNMILWDHHDGKAAKVWNIWFYGFFVGQQLYRMEVKQNYVIIVIVVQQVY